MFARFVCGLAGLLFLIPPTIASAQNSQDECRQFLPAGITIRLQPDEPLVAGRTAGSTLFTVVDDVGLFAPLGGSQRYANLGQLRPLTKGSDIIIPRGSKVLARVARSRQAGRLVGRAVLELAFDVVLTRSCAYPITAELVAAGRPGMRGGWYSRYKVKKGALVGDGRAKRDTLLLLLPATTLFQLAALPSRGPELSVDPESELLIKLTQPVLRSAGVPFSEYATW